VRPGSPRLGLELVSAAEVDRASAEVQVNAKLGRKPIPSGLGCDLRPRCRRQIGVFQHREGSRIGEQIAGIRGEAGFDQKLKPALEYVRFGGLLREGLDKVLLDERLVLRPGEDELRDD